MSTHAEERRLFTPLAVNRTRSTSSRGPTFTAGCCRTPPTTIAPTRRQRGPTATSPSSSRRPPRTWPAPAASRLARTASRSPRARSAGSRLTTTSPTRRSPSSTPSCTTSTKGRPRCPTCCACSATRPSAPSCPCGGARSGPRLFTALAATRYDELPVRHNEEVVNEQLADKLPWPVERSRFDSPHVKANLLLQAHFARAPLPMSDYVTDLKSVLDQALRILQAAAECGGRDYPRSPPRDQPRLPCRPWWTSRPTPAGCTRRSAR